MSVSIDYTLVYVYFSQVNFLFFSLFFIIFSAAVHYSAKLKIPQLIHLILSSDLADIHKCYGPFHLDHKGSNR